MVIEHGALASHNAALWRGKHDHTAMYNKRCPIIVPQSNREHWLNQKFPMACSCSSPVNGYHDAPPPRWLMADRLPWFKVPGSKVCCLKIMSGYFGCLVKLFSFLFNCNNWNMKFSLPIRKCKASQNTVYNEHQVDRRGGRVALLVKRCVQQETRMCVGGGR